MSTQQTNANRCTDGFKPERLLGFQSSIILALLAAGMMGSFAPRAEAGVVASGGTVTGYIQNGTNYIAHTFTTVGTNSFSVTSVGNVEVLVVGGGGGGCGADNGQGAGGGGGGGGLIYTNLTLVTSNYTVFVGQGGTNGLGNANETAAMIGSNSVFGSLTALGGGGGWRGTAANGNGGSGGGGFGRGLAGGTAQQPGSSSGGYGNNGGKGNGTSSTDGGGGGGGGGAGSGGTNSATKANGGNGGAGLNYDISGVSKGYAGGGGGGVQSGTTYGTATHGGGNGSISTTVGGDGTSNTGGGGGGGAVSGSGQAGGKGGSGIVIVRYAVQPQPSQMKVTFGGYTNRSEVLTNFPVLVVFSNNINNSGFHYGYFATTNGTDLRFGTDATPPTIGLNYEIESWNPNGASYVWVQVPSIPTDGTGAIWANWGNTSASNQLACTTNGATWTNGFSSVWHFGRTNGVPDLRDSTSYQRNGANVGSVSATGRVGMGVDMESGESDYVDVPTGLGSTFIPANNSQITLSCWFNPESIVASGDLQNRLINIHDNSVGPSSAILLSLGQGNKLQALIDGSTAGGAGLTLTNAPSVSTANWYHGALTYDGDVGILYQDGMEGRRTAAGAKLNAGAAYPAKLGAVAPAVAVFYDGLLDEVRISSVARSTNWVWAEYLNMVSNTVFNNYGAMASQAASSALPIIANLAAANVTATSADLVGSLTSTGTSDTAVWVYWGTTDGATNAADWAYTNFFGTNTVGATAYTTNTADSGASFDKGTKCYYNFYAQNASGGVWAATAAPSASFTTLTNPVVTVSAASVGVGTATLNGTLTSDGGATSTVYFCWGTNDFLNNATSDWPNVVSFGTAASGQSVSNNLTGLTYGIRYWYRVYATNSAGDAWSAPTNFVTAAPSGVSATGGAMTTNLVNGTNYITHTFSTTGTSSFVASVGGQVEIYAWGGGGGGGQTAGSTGGGGGAAQGTATIGAGTYAIVVGGRGTYQVNPGNAGNPVAGGGGVAGAVGGGGQGGGYSGIFANSIAQANVVLIAGGGGGGGYAGNGGAGGGINGAAGTGSNPGGGGTQSAGGVGGNGTSGPGTALQGGTAGTDGDDGGGGGGGGGYWGGGAGYNGDPNGNSGGGGGSAYTNPVYVASGALTAGSGQTAGDSGNALRGSAGNGGALNGAGNSGIVIVRYVTGGATVGIANTFATNVQATSATLQATLTGSNSYFDVWAYWGPADGTNNVGAWSNTAHVGEFTLTTVSSNIAYTASSGITTGTTYYYTFFASNAATNIWASPSASFLSLGPPTLDNGASGATGIGVGAATLNGRLLTQSADNMAICWGTNDCGDATNLWPNVASFGAKTAPASVSTNLTGLTYGIRYWYRTYATNAYGEAWSAATNFVTASSGVLPTVGSARAFWLDASTLTGADGSTVSSWQWKNSSDVGAAMTLSNSPTLRTGANGMGTGQLPVVRFASGYAYTDGFSQNGDQSTVFVVARENVVQGGYTGIVSASTQGNYNDHDNIARYTMDHNNGASLKIEHSGNRAAGFYTPTAGRSFVWTLDLNISGSEVPSGPAAGTAYTYIKDAIGATTNGNWAPGQGTLNVNRFVVAGRWTANAFNYRWSGDIGEVLAYNAALNDADRTSIETYLHDKWVTGIRPPAITNTTATAVGATQATLNGTLTGTNSYFDVYAYWGPTDGTNNPAAWSSNAWVGAFTLSGATTSSNIAYTADLVPDTGYWYTLCASNAATNIWATPSKSFIAGEVTVQATVATTKFGDPDGQFTISRPAGCTNIAMTVYYAMSGSASNGLDYDLVSGTASLGLGVTSTVVSVTAQPDADTTNEEAVLTLLQSPAYNYLVGAASNATVTIQPLTSAKTWVGGTSTAWTNGANWNPSGVPASTNDVIIDGGANQPTLNLSGGAVTIKTLTIGATSNSTLTVSNGDVTTKKLIVTGDVTIGPTGTLTHAAETSTSTAIDSENHRLFLDVGGNLTIAAGGKIDVRGMGYGYGNYRGPGGAGTSGGGGYGGQGGGASGGTTYGSVTNPVNSGSSGGGSGGTSGRPGGGTARVNVGGMLTLNGSILADGAVYTSLAEAAGGGAGGSVNIVAGSLSGNGTVSANGGGTTTTGGGNGGGGGRIAVVLTNANDSAFAGLTAIRAYAGPKAGTSAYGGAGTVYLKGTNQTYGTLIVNNSGGSASLNTLHQTSTNQFDTIVTTNGARFMLGTGAQLTMTGCNWLGDTSSKIIVITGSGQIMAPALTIPTNATLSLSGTNRFSITSDVTVTNGGTLTHEVVTSTGSTLENHKLIATIVGNLTIAAGGKIDVTAKGYVGDGNGPGSTGSAGGGGSYGGEGGGSSGTTYGSVTNPVNCGSAGRRNNGGTTALAAGGAAIVTVSGVLTLNGSILADGYVAASSGETPAGGAGGSVNVVAGALSGNGTISANGGGITTSGGANAGGGGRIAVVLTNASDTAIYGLQTIRAYTGPKVGANTYGGGGTIYLKGTNQTYGTLIVDNNQSVTKQTLINAGVTDATVGDVILRNSGNLGVASQTLTVYGSWSNAAMFSAGAGGIVTLAGTGALATNTLFGSTTFGTLVCTNAGKTLLFQAGKTNTMLASLNIAGASGAGNPISLLPATAGQQWYIKVTNTFTPTLSYLIVKNSTAVTNANGRSLAPEYSTFDDVGVDNSLAANANTNWSFASAAAKVWNGSVSTSWETGGNWDPDGVAPAPSDVGITIPTNAYNRYPILGAAHVGLNAYPCPLAISNGASLSLGGYNLTLNGDVSNAGTIIATGTETLTFGSNVVFTGTGAFTPASSTVVLGGSGAQSVTLNGQTFYNLSISNANAVTVTDGFVARNLTFPATGASVNFGGGFTATNMTLSVSGAATLNFAAGQTYTVRNALYLRGASSGNRAVLTSSGTWYLNALGYYTARQLAVTNSDATGSGKILYAVDSTGSGTTYWDFGAGNQLWVGSNTTWAAAGNWSPSGIPGPSSMVFIDGSTNTIPTVSAATTIAGLTVAGGAGAASLSLAMPYAGPDRLTVNGDVNVAANGTLTQAANPAAATYRLAMTVNGNLNVAAGGLIDVTGKGHSAGDLTAPGYAGYQYGAGHGGVGGGTAGGTTYGSVTNPLTLGSSTSGGNMGPQPGGGVVLLSVRDTLTLDGMIRAEGEPGASGGAISGGSGGSVNIMAGNVSGTGTVSAAGGRGQVSTTCGGGGGRVAIVLTNAGDTAFASLAAIQAYGGAPSGGEYGAAGTVYLKGTNQAYGRLTVNNNSKSSTRLTLLNSAVTEKTVGDVVLQNLGYVGISAGETLTVYGSWSNAVATNAISGGTVVFAGTNAATVWGGNGWSNLTIATAGKTVQFQTNAIQYVYGTPVFSNNVTLKSTSDGTWWYLLKPGTGTQDVSVVTVQDSNATNGWLFRAAVHSTDLGHNVNWQFLQPAGTVFMIR